MHGLRDLCARVSGTDHRAREGKSCYSDGSLCGMWHLCLCLSVRGHCERSSVWRLRNRDDNLFLKEIDSSMRGRCRSLGKREEESMKVNKIDHICIAVKN